MPRLKLLFLAFACLVLLPASVLLTYGQRFLAADEKRLRAEAEADRAQALGAAIEEVRAAVRAVQNGESTRPWYHYGNHFVPPDLISNVVAFDQSPLFPAPRDALIRCYFEWTPQRTGLATPAEGVVTDDEEVAAAAQAHAGRVRALEPDLEPVLKDLFARRAVLFAEPVADEVTSKFLVACHTNADQTLHDLEDAKKGDVWTQKKLETQWAQHKEVQAKARKVYSGVNRSEGKPAADQAQQEKAQQTSFGYGRDNFGNPGQYPANAALPEIRAKLEAAEPEAAAIRIYATRLAWVATRAPQVIAASAAEAEARAMLDAALAAADQRRGRAVPAPAGSAAGASAGSGAEKPRGRVLVAVRLVDLDGQLVLQGYELDTASLSESLAGVLHRRGLDAAVSVREAKSPADVFELTAKGPLAAGHLDVLKPSRRLLYGSAILILFLATAGLAVLYGIVTGHLELARRRTDFVAAVSHELKAPLTAIRALAEMLSLGICPTREKEMEYFGHIQAESERLSRLVTNVLELARLERRERPYDLYAGDAAEVVRAVTETFRPHLAAKGFAFEVVLEPDLPAVHLDRDALSQVVANLLDNAIKYTAPCEAKRVVVRVARRAGGEVAIEVEDKGIGIDPADRARLFQRFARGSAPLARGTGGAGLGLSIAKEHVDAHGGRLEVESEPGKGSLFRIVLPAAPS